MQRLDALLAVARIERAVENETIRMVLLHSRITLGGVETVLVEIGQIGRLQDRHIVVAGYEQVIEHRLGVVLLELAEFPLLRRWAEIGMVGIKALDELLAVNVLLVRRASVPEMRMSVDDKNFLTFRGLVHGVFSCSRRAG